MDLNNLLTAAEIDPGSVLVLRHRPLEPDLRVLPWFAEEHPDLFNAYQSTHRPRAEISVLKASHIASFLAHGAGRALFVGLFRQNGSIPLTFDEFWRVEEHQILKKHGMGGFTGERPSLLRFDLQPMECYANWKGRLIVGWPAPERAWFRWADRNDFPVQAILEDSALVRAMPQWDEIVLAWDQLEVLPGRWQATLAEWRGIYLITDVSDGKAYVGSACGSGNILGRWQDYVRTGHGENKRLRERNPRNFRFSILERVSPDLPADSVNLREANWKERLHTRLLGLNEN